MPRRARMVRLWQRIAARAEAKQPAHLPNHCRTAIVEALAEHAVACRLPHMPCMAFWRFWEPRSKPAQQSGGSGADASSPGSSPGCSGGGGGAPQAAGREAEWEALALLLHMIAEGASSSSSTSKEAAAAAHQLLQQLNVSGTAVPAILAHGAVSGSSKAVQFAAARAILLMAQLPANLTQLTEALLRASEAAAASDADGDAAAGRVAGPACVIGAFESDGGRAAGRAAALLWELCYSPASGGTFPKAVQTLQQHGALLLPVLEAALGPEQGRLAGCRWLAAGLLACATYEPPAGAPGAAAAADGMRHLLSSPHAASALQRLVGLLQSDIAAAHPQAARAAALAVAHIAAYRGALAAGGNGGPALPEASPGMRAKFAGLTTRLLRQGGSGAGSGDWAREQVLHSAAAGSGDFGRAVDDLPTEPRAALVHHGAPQLLLRLVVHCSAAAAAGDATAAAASRAPAGPALPTPLVTPTAQQQAAAAAAAAAESAAEQRSVLAAVLQALNNVCVDPAAAARLHKWARPNAETQQHLTAALTAAMSDRQLSPATREHARLLLHTASGAPGQRHALVRTLLAPPLRAPAYPCP